MEPSALLPRHALRLSAGLPSVLPLVRSGRCVVQDEAAASVVLLLDPRPGERVADICASPGGKALFAAALVSGGGAAAGAAQQQQGRVLAVDVNPGRVALLKRAAEAQGLAEVVSAVAADSTTLPDERPRLRGVLDRVLVDAPCTGLGVLSKRADLRWRRTEADLRGLLPLQDALLLAGAALVRPGGVLVYSTCSTEPEENEGAVERFLGAVGVGEWEVEEARGVLPAELAAAGALSACGRFLQPLPHRTGTDGAFAARLRRRS